MAGNFNEELHHGACSLLTHESDGTCTRFMVQRRDKHAAWFSKDLGEDGWAMSIVFCWL